MLLDALERTEAKGATDLFGAADHLAEVLPRRSLVVILSDLLDDRADALKRIDEGECVIDPTIVTRLLKRSRERGPLDELTDREREVLGLMAEGRSNSAISQTLLLSPKTVEANVGQIFRKLDLPPSADDHRRVLAVLEYLRAGA